MFARSDSQEVSSHGTINSPHQGIQQHDIVMPPEAEWTGEIIKDAVNNNGYFVYDPGQLDAFLKDEVAHDK